MGRGLSHTLPTVSADELHRFFDDKVADIRASTEDAPQPSFSTAPSYCSLCDFRLLIDDDVINAVRTLPDKQCASDPLPTRLLKDNVDILAPFLVVLCNQSLSIGVVPKLFEAAYIAPILKKALFGSG